MDMQIADYVIYNAYSSVYLSSGQSEFPSFTAEEIIWKTSRCTGITGDKGSHILFRHKFGYMEYTLGFFIPESGRCILIDMSICNKDARALHLSKIKVIGVDKRDGKGKSYFKISDNPETCYVYTNTYYKTPSMVRRLTNGFDSRFLDKNGDIRYLDRDYSPGWQGKYDGIIFDTVSKRSAVFGFVSYFRFMGEIELKYESYGVGNTIGEFSLVNTCEDYMLKQGDECCSETAYISFSGGAHESQAHFAQTLGIVMGAKFLGHPMSGWCSWHQRFFEIDEEFVLKNAGFAASRRDVFTTVSGGFEYIQVDYGWQKFIGSLETDNERFPHGMKWIADRIHSLGFKAGIWIAPFWIDEGCGLHETNPDFLIHDENGNLLREDTGFKGMPFYRLDVSNPYAVKYAVSQLDYIINEWGYDMVKMDFLEMATIRPLPGEVGIRLYDLSRTSHEHFRNACAAMQDYVDSMKKDIFLSPCGSPTLFLTGIFRSNYVAEDAVVKPSPDSWDEHAGVKSFVRSWATKYYLNNRTWTNNNESVIFDDRRPFNEALINAVSAALSGGIYFTGDDLTRLSEERLILYSRLLPIYRETALPLDLFDGLNPSIWKLPVKTGWDEWIVLGLFNLEDFQIDIDLSPDIIGYSADKEYLVFNFWEQSYQGTYKGQLAVRGIPARSVRLLCIREKRDRPMLLSTDIHFTQGAAEFRDIVWHEDNLKLELCLKNYRTGIHKIHVYIPEGYALKGLSPEGIHIDMSGSICTVTYDVQETGYSKIQLSFAKVQPG